MEGGTRVAMMNKKDKELIKDIQEMLPDVSKTFLERVFDPKAVHKEFLIHVTVSIAEKVYNADIVEALQFAGVIKKPSFDCYFCSAKGTAHWRRKIYYCHECNAQMNAVEFLMTYKKMSFEEAFRLVLESILEERSEHGNG